MLFRFLSLIHVCAAFPLKCPEPAQWSLRARSHCSDASKYFCLRNDLINGYSENCTVYDFLQPGRKNVLRGGLDADICSSERYQPWPINFYTNVSTNCIFLKSLCNEEGQVVYNHGNRNTDTTCKCDYTRGYDFIIKHQNPCFCEPTKEDCSCYLKTCPKSTNKLSPDYECLEGKKNLTVSECKEMISVRRNTTRDDNTKKYISESENMSNKVIHKIIVTAICIGLILYLCILFLLDELLDRYYREVYFIYQPNCDIEKIEGENARIKYKLSTNRFPVSILKDNQFIPETSSIKKSVVDRSKKLKFNYVAPSDAGTYCLEVAGRKSNQIKMIIKPMFTAKIDPQICIEGNRLELTCSVYADNIEVQWYKEKEPLHNCKNLLINKNKYQRMLTIEKAAIEDSGKYYVKAKNVEIEIPVIVKDMLRRPLVDVTIMEGLDAKFEFETEEKNIPVQWFHDGKNISETTDKRQIHRLQGRVNTLTISQASVKDSGNYGISIKGCDHSVKLHVKELPETIQNMSVSDREAFLKAANTGTTKRYNIRVMIVGKQSAGKTCLLRRLMNEEIVDVKSTDGINIERRKCHIDIKTGKWHFSKSGEKPEILSIDKSEEFADCAFWDFAGQKEFYATHQTFLSANAVYLLVVDISEDFKSKTYENMIEKEFDSIGEYIDFWLDNIHCYCTDNKNASMQCNDNLDLNPPVIIIGTGIDKIPLDDREKRKSSFLEYLNISMSLQEKRRHFRKPHFLSNTIPSDNKQEFEKLRTDILLNAKALSNWEENLPIRWIVLEKEMHRKQRERTILLSEAEGEKPKYENEKVILYTEARSLANECSFPDVKKETSELDSFLKFEHEIGNIVFFKEVEEYIVLDPEWLVDVFRCFVSHDYNGEALGMPEWAVLNETGKLEDTLIEKLLKKVPSLILTKHKQYILKLMEEFGIIVKPKNDDYSNDIYMPCMIKPRPFQEILRKVDVKSEYCIKSSWFCLVFNFLPPSYFNHILVSFVKNNQLLHDQKDCKLSIYRNVGIFQLNETGSEILVICLSKNVISMQVIQLKSENGFYSYVKNRLINLVDLIKQRYRINVIYEIRFKCADGSLLDNEGIGYEEAIVKSEYRCTEHEEMHSSKAIYRPWFKEEEVEEERKNKGHRKCNYCKHMSVCKCYDCNQVLCRDCYGKHGNTKKYSTHLMQLISDSFILNCKFPLEDDVNGSILRYMKDIKYLPDGEVAAAVYNNNNGIPELMVFSISGKRRHVIPLNDISRKMDVMDKHTVVVLMEDDSVAIVDIQQKHVQYIRNNAIPYRSDTLIYIENEFYISDEYGIVVFDMAGNEKRRITLSFTTCDMCYDVNLQHIYCIDRDKRSLICIDRDGNDIFTFAGLNMTNLIDLTIDNDGNVLVLCKKVDAYSGCVIKVDSNGDKSEVVITNINTLHFKNRICYDHLTDSVVIASDNEVYVYKKK